MHYKKLFIGCLLFTLKGQDINININNLGGHFITYTPTDDQKVIAMVLSHSTKTTYSFLTTTWWTTHSYSRSIIAIGLLSIGLYIWYAKPACLKKISFWEPN
ncbi:MAG: hypothetical protein WA432_04305 [Candidatus Babeliaceae bacterium]